MFYQKKKNLIEINLKVVPNASKNEISDIIEGEFGKKLLKIRIAAVPDDGKANKALIKFLSKEWKIPQSAIYLKSGVTSRKKTIEIKGDIEQMLKALTFSQNKTPRDS